MMSVGEISPKFGVFVARERELDEFRHALDEAWQGRGRLFLVSGEPGIGKTRLAEEVAREASARGMRVVWGRCWEGTGAPAYWPWIQIIRALHVSSSAEEFKPGLPPVRTRAIAQIVPELRPTESAGETPAKDKVEPEQTRFLLFDAVSNLLKADACHTPILLVLDDLHDADDASLALLQFIARDLKAAPLVIIATYRDLEVRRSSGVTRHIGELSREARLTPLKNLGAQEVKLLVASIIGRAPDDELVTKLCAATNGNPLFVEGIVRNLMAEGGLASTGAIGRPFRVPSGIREAIRMRLEGLSPETKAILATAAVIGNEFEFEVCRSAAEVSTEAARKCLDEAAEAEVIGPILNGRYRFSHALMRSTVYDELDTNARVRIHGRIATRLEEFYRNDLAAHFTELAHHFREAGATKKAIDYFSRAVMAAHAVFAFTDAVMYGEAALALMEASGSPTSWRAELLASLGALTFEIDQAKSVEYSNAAVALYESIGCLEEAAATRIRLGTIFVMSGHPMFNAGAAREHFRRSETVLAKGPETNSLAFLYARIAVAEVQSLDLERCEWAARRAMEITDRVGAQSALAKSIWGDAASMFAQSLILRGKLKEGFALLEPAFKAMVETNQSAQGVVWVGGGYSSWLGDPRGARSWFQRELNRPINAHAPYRLQFLRSSYDNTYFDEGLIDQAIRLLGPENWTVRFWIGGEWEAILALEEEALLKAERVEDLLARLNWSLIVGKTCHHLGDLARAEAHLRFGLEASSGRTVVAHEMRARPPLALLFASMNRLDEAASQVLRCREIMADGEDWRGLAGEVARVDATVTAMRGDLDLADRLFESALELNRRYHAAWEEAQTLYCWGRMLAFGRDLKRAEEKFDAAIENHRSRGVGRRMLEWLEADKKLVLSGSAGAGPFRPKKVAAGLKKEGEFWTLAYRDTHFRLKDSKGLRYLAVLLTYPEERFPAGKLVAIVEGAPDKSVRGAGEEGLSIADGLGIEDTVLDWDARANYRMRLKELRADLEEAERFNDLGRCERLRDEIEYLNRELNADFGVAGHGHRRSAQAERARKMVGKNIRKVIERIRPHSPALARHFARSIKTGYFCSYEPTPDETVFWQFD